MSRSMFDHSRDDELARALADAVPRPPVDDVDWAALHARITASATPLLRRTDVHREVQPLSWWQPLAQWSRHGIPLAAAASTVLMLGAAWLVATAPSTDAFLMVEEALVGGVAHEAQPLLAGAEAVDMLDAALFQTGEEW